MTTANTGGFQFTPATGLNDTATYPTTPASEIAARQQFMDMYWQLMNEMNLPTASASAYAQYNKLINGNFDVWQRGTSFTNPVSGTYTTDRFSASLSYDGGVAPTTLTHSRQQTTNGELLGANYFYRINNDSLGSAFGTNAIYQLRQKVENGVRYLCGSGKKVTLSFWAKSSIASKKVGVYLGQSYGSGGSPSAGETLLGQTFTLTSSWQKFTYTFTSNTLNGKTFGTNNDDTIDVYLVTMWGSVRATSIFGVSTTETFVGTGNIDIAQVQINAGDQALPCQPRNIADELALCQRYYYKSFDNNQGSVGNVMSIASSNAVLSPSVPFPVQMRISPTVTISNNNVVNQVRNSNANTTVALAGMFVGKNSKFISYLNFTANGSITAGQSYDYDVTADAEL